MPEIEVVRLGDLVSADLLDYVARALAESDGCDWSVTVEWSRAKVYRAYARTALEAFVSWQQRN